MAFLWRISGQSSSFPAVCCASSGELRFHVASELQKKRDGIRSGAVASLDLHQNHHVLRLGQLVDKGIRSVASALILREQIDQMFDRRYAMLHQPACSTLAQCLGGFRQAVATTAQKTDAIGEQRDVFNLGRFGQRGGCNGSGL